MDILKLYVKTFLFFAVIIGVSFYLIFHYVEPGYSVDASVIGAIIGVIVGGGIITLFVAGRQVGRDGVVMSTNASEEIMLKKDLKGSFQASVEVLKKLGFKIEDENPEARILKASSGFKLNSYGEKVLLTFEIISTTETQIKIISRPKVGLNFIDSGTNYINVKKISDALKIAI